MHAGFSCMYFLSINITKEKFRMESSASLLSILVIGSKYIITEKYVVYIE